MRVSTYTSAAVFALLYKEIADKRTGWRQQERAFTLTEAEIFQPDDHRQDTIRDLKAKFYVSQLTLRASMKTANALLILQFCRCAGGHRSSEQPGARSCNAGCNMTPLCSTSNYLLLAGMKMACALLTFAMLGASTTGRHLMSERPSMALSDALAALAKDKTIIVSQASCGYLDFADNWVAHLGELGIDNWLIIAQDTAALEYLTQRQAT